MLGQQSKAGAQSLGLNPLCRSWERCDSMDRLMPRAHLRPPDSHNTVLGSAAISACQGGAGAEVLCEFPAEPQHQLVEGCRNGMGRGRLGRGWLAAVPSEQTPGCVYSGKSRALIPKVWSPDQHQHHLGICCKCHFLVPTPHLWDQKYWPRGPATCFNKPSR